jgi:hypothetical protein
LIGTILVGCVLIAPMLADIGAEILFSNENLIALISDVNLNSRE